MSRSEQKQGEQEDYISYEEFSKVHLKIGKVIQAEGVPGMKKVFKIRVDIGADQRDLVVGAAPFYKPEELVGKVVVVCTNLEPKKIGGIVSNGMGDHTALCLSDDFFQSELLKIFIGFIVK